MSEERETLGNPDADAFEQKLLKACEMLEGEVERIPPTFGDNDIVRCNIGDAMFQVNDSGTRAAVAQGDVQAEIHNLTDMSLHYASEDRENFIVEIHNQHGDNIIWGLDWPPEED